MLAVNSKVSIAPERWWQDAVWRWLLMDWAYNLRGLVNLWKEQLFVHKTHIRNLRFWFCKKIWPYDYISFSSRVSLPV